MHSGTAACAMLAGPIGGRSAESNHAVDVLLYRRWLRLCRRVVACMCGDRRWRSTPSTKMQCTTSRTPSRTGEPYVALAQRAADNAQCTNALMEQTTCAMRRTRAAAKPCKCSAAWYLADYPDASLPFRTNQHLRLAAIQPPRALHHAVPGGLALSRTMSAAEHLKQNCAGGVRHRVLPGTILVGQPQQW
jgi:hypothetical protein